MAQRIIAAGNSLKDFPLRGRQASGAVRELPIIYPYIIRYVVGPGIVRIIRIKHGAQRL
jgi:plasmid stabilization system protein ParE